jgi:hypothetical protein
MGHLKHQEIAAMEPKPHKWARRWIPVEEALPEPGESVLVFLRFLDKNGTPSCIGCDGNGGMITVATLDRIDGHNLWTSEYGDEMPRHWMPLPAPPEVK